MIIFQQKTGKTTIFSLKSPYQWLIWSLLFILCQGNVNGQTHNNYWFARSNSIDFTFDPPIPRASQVSFGAGSILIDDINSNNNTSIGACNGVHTPDGRLLFQVVGKNIMNVYGAAEMVSRQNASQIIGNGYNIGEGTPSQEVAIFKKSNCGNYGIVYGRYVNHNNMTTDIAITDVDTFNHNNAQHSVTNAATNRAGFALYYTTYQTPQKGAKRGTIIEPQLILKTRQSNAVGMAMSKVNAEGKRHLYVALGGPSETSRLVKVVFGENGYEGATILWQSDDRSIEFGTIEMDLSPNGRMLAFGRTKRPSDTATHSNKDIIVFHLDKNGNLAQPQPTTYDILIGDDSQAFMGVEFSQDNQYLYCGVLNQGIGRLELSTGFYRPISNTTEYSNSQLEANLSLGERIYAINLNVLGYIDPLTNRILTIRRLNEVADNQFSLNTTNLTLEMPLGFSMLPDQIDGEDYRSWTADYASNAACCEAVNYNDNAMLSKPIAISQQVIWNPLHAVFPFTSANSVITEGVIVKRGHHLEIRDMTLKFGAQANIVVENGATLIVNNSTLTATDCNNTWGGIVSNGGNIIINNYSNINYALIGVNATGGSLRVQEATFYNNQKDIYVADNVMDITNPYDIQQTTFKVDNPYGSTRIAQSPKKLDDFFTKSSAYPNPAKDFTTIEYVLPEYYPENVLLITDIAGQVVQTVALKQHKGQFLWDTRNVKAGMYFYKIQYKGDTKAVGKIVVTK